MKLLIFLLLFVTKVNDNVATGIFSSNIPDDCKQLYLAITIKESGWHKNKNAVIKNNYSGFMLNGSLMKFATLSHYLTFSEKWFIRKNIKNEKDLIKLIKQGRYANLSKKQLAVYLQQLLIIKNKTKYLSNEKHNL